jgi:hypothetical protein
MMILAASLLCVLPPVQKMDDDSFAYPMEQLYGMERPLRLRLMVNGMSYQKPYTRLGWTSPSMRMAIIWLCYLETAVALTL